MPHIMFAQFLESAPQVMAIIGFRFVQSSFRRSIRPVLIKRCESLFRLPNRKGMEPAEIHCSSQDRTDVLPPQFATSFPALSVVDWCSTVAIRATSFLSFLSAFTLRKPPHDSRAEPGC